MTLVNQRKKRERLVIEEGSSRSWTTGGSRGAPAGSLSPSYQRLEDSA